MFSFLTPATSNQMALNELTEMTGRQELPYLLLIVCLLGPITEELVYRGVLMNTFLKDSPWYGDVLLSACVFWLCACQFRFNTTRLFHLCKWRSNLCIPLPKNSFSLLPYFTSYHDQHYCILGIMGTLVFW